MRYRVKISLAIMLTVLLTLGAAGYSLLPESEKEITNHYYPSFLQGEANISDRVAGETAAHKNETVYVVIDNQGQVLEQSIVNRIYGQEDPNAGLVVDYGHYLELTNMMSSDLPITDLDKILWDSSLLKIRNLYYTGRVEQQLPVSIEISYILNGEAISPEELSGRSGRLDLVFKFTNNLQHPEKLSYYDYNNNLVYSDDPNYVPFLVQGTLDLDLNRFSEIDPGEGMVLVMGQVASVNFMTFPYPKSEVMISMTGEDIELERVNLMVAPQLPAFPEVDLEAVLTEMLEGVQLFSGVFSELSGGADQLSSAMSRLQNESRNFTGDSREISDLLKHYEDGAEAFRQLFEDDEFYNLVHQLKDLEVMLNQVESIPGAETPVAVISDSLDGIAKAQDYLDNSRTIMVALDNSSAIIVREAEEIAAHTPPGSREHELALQVIEREGLLKKAIHDNSKAAATLAGSAAELQEFQEVWFSEYEPGLEAIKELQKLMAAGDINYWFSSIIRELENFDAYYEEAEDLISEAKTLMENLEQLPLALDYLAEGQSLLAEGLNALGSEGLGTMEQELIRGINETKEGKAKLELMKKLADDYRSYADNLNNRHSEVRFVIQSARLVEKQDEVTLKENKYLNENMTWTERIWKKMIGLFQ